MVSMSPVRFFTAAALCGVLIPAGAWAHDGAMGVVKERMEMMKSMAGHMKALNAMARGGGPVDADAVRQAVKSLRDHGAALPKKFPEGTHHPPSEAKPEIWQEKEKFQALWAALLEQVSALSGAGETGDRAAVANAFRGVGKVCSSCHKTFRSKR